MQVKRSSLSGSFLDDVAASFEVERIRAALGPDTPLYLVGGTVRDALLGTAPKDLDLTLPLVPDEITPALERAQIRVLPTGLRHQTVTVLVAEGAEPIEITTFHGAEMSPKGGVKAAKTIEEDLAHRDFTINAMAFDLRSHEVVDPFGGKADLAARIVKAVGESEKRFAEDPLRLLRMVRFACSLQFEIDPATQAAAAASASLLRQVSVERIRDEFTKILLSPVPVRGLSLLQQLGFLEAFLPELLEGVNFEQNRFHRADVFQHTLEVVGRSRPELLLRLAALFHDIAKPRTLSVDPETGDRHFFFHEKVGADLTEEVLTRLRYPNATVDAVSTLVYTHMRPLEAGPGGLRRLLRDTGEYFDLWRELKEIDTLSCRVEPEEFYARLAVFDAGIEEVKKGPALSPLSSLALKGTDLIAAGVPAGPIIGKILRALHERVLDDPSLNEREKLLEKVPALRSELEAKSD